MFKKEKVNNKMTKSIILFALLVVFVSGPRDTHGKRARVPNCTLSENTIGNYNKGRDLIFTFLENAEVDFRKMSDDEKTISCQLTKGNLSEIIVKGKEDLTKCLVEDFEYFGGFLNDVFQNFLSFFCENSNEDLEEYFSEEAKQCRASIQKPLFDNCLTFLIKNTKIDYDLSFKGVFVPGKRDELCRQLLDVGTCTADLLKSHCSYSDFYRSISAKLFAQTVKPCDEYVTYITTARIVGIILTIICFVIILVIRFCPVRRWIEDFRRRTTSKSLSNPII